MNASKGKNIDGYQDLIIKSKSVFCYNLKLFSLARCKIVKKHSSGVTFFSFTVNLLNNALNFIYLVSMPLSRSLLSLIDICCLLMSICSLSRSCSFIYYCWSSRSGWCRMSEDYSRRVRICYLSK